MSDERSNVARLTAVVVLVGSLAILAVAWWTKPDPSGYGTHQRLGLPPCGFLYTTGLPCPTCGMTTAFAYAVRGHLLQAVVAQPAGAALAGLTFVLAGVAGVVLVTGRRIEINWYRINPMYVLVTAIVLFVGSWALKIVMVLYHHNGLVRSG